MPDAREVFTEIEKRIAAKPDKIKGLNATYQFDLTGESWTLRIQDGQLTLDSGPAECRSSRSRAIWPWP